MAPSGSVEEEQPDAPISNCVATVQMLHFTSDTKKQGKQHAEEEEGFMSLHLPEDKTTSYFCFTKKKEYNISRDPINIS